MQLTLKRKIGGKNCTIFYWTIQATPHTTTKFAPAELLFNREINTKIDQQVQENDEKGKRNMKINAEKSANAKEVDIKVKTLRMVLNRTPPGAAEKQSAINQH